MRPCPHGDPTYEQWLSNTPPGFEGEDSPKPPFVNGEPQYQPPNDAWVEDCNLAGRLAYVTSDGVFRGASLPMVLRSVVRSWCHLPSLQS